MMFEADQTLSMRRWHVVRIGSNSHVEAVLLSSRFFCLTTHWNNCTLPCCGDNCKLCEILPGRGLFYVAVGVMSEIMMLELGAASAAHLEQHAKLLHGGMAPGLVFELTRRGKKQPVRSEVLRVKEGCKEIVELDLAAHVMALYKFPCPNPQETIETYSERCARVARVRCDRAFELIMKKAERSVKQV